MPASQGVFSPLRRIFVAASVSMMAAAAGADGMFWSDDRTGPSSNISTAALDGSGVAGVVTTGMFRPSGVALDVPGGRMYWTDGKDLWSAGIDGAGAAAMGIPGLNFPRNIVLDRAGGWIYFNDVATQQLARVGFGGGTPEVLLSALGFVEDFDVDLLAGRIYWTLPQVDRIMSSRLDGSDVTIVVATGANTNPTGIAVDPLGAKMYWTNNFSGSHKLLRANVDGTSVEVLIGAGLTSPQDIALDVRGGKMYWTSGGGQRILRANLDGSGVETLVTGLGNPTSIALMLAENPTSRFSTRVVKGEVRDFVKAGRDRMQATLALDPLSPGQDVEFDPVLHDLGLAVGPGADTRTLRVPSGDGTWTVNYSPNGRHRWSGIGDDGERWMVMVQPRRGRATVKVLGLEFSGPPDTRFSVRLWLGSQRATDTETFVALPGSSFNPKNVNGVLRFP